MKSLSNKIYGALTITLMALVIFWYMRYEMVLDKMVYYGYLEQSYATTGIKNMVTGIYLDFRVFDTLFEALLLLVSIIAIFQFTTIQKNENRLQLPSFQHDNHKDYELPRYMMSIIYPLFAVLGLYIIYNGADSPGGGFQGGAILATLLISRYIVSDQYNYKAKVPYILEKIIFLLIVIGILYFLGYRVSQERIRFYMLMMNLLIGLKVCAGFSAIFIKLVKGGE